MEKRRIKEAVKNILKRSKKPLWEDEIAKKLNVSVFNIVKITRELEEQGLVRELK